MMFSMAVKIEDKTADVVKAADKAAYTSFGHAAASIRIEARESITTNPSPGRGRKKKRGKGSPVGTPPYTRRGQLRNAVVYQVDRYGAIIGPRFGRAGTSGFPHEFGASYRGEKFKSRPFMSPALLRNVGRFAGSWRNSITP